MPCFRAKKAALGQHSREGHAFVLAKGLPQVKGIARRGLVTGQRKSVLGNVTFMDTSHLCLLVSHEIMEVSPFNLFFTKLYLNLISASSNVYLPVRRPGGHFYLPEACCAQISANLVLNIPCCPISTRQSDQQREFLFTRWDLQLPERVPISITDTHKMHLSKYGTQFWLLQYMYFYY